MFEPLWPHEAHAHEAALGAGRAQTRRPWKTRRSQARSRPISYSRPRSWRSRLPQTPGKSDVCLAGRWSSAVVAIGITAAVYGVVALIVKADDVGVALAAERRNAGTRRAGPRARSAPLAHGDAALPCLSACGIAAMIWVGGGIIVHGLETYGISAIAHAIHAAGEGAAHALPAVGSAAEWIVTAGLSGLVGFVVGAAAIPAAGFHRAGVEGVKEPAAATPAPCLSAR